MLGKLLVSATATACPLMFVATCNRDHVLLYDYNGKHMAEEVQEVSIVLRTSIITFSMPVKPVTYVGDCKQYTTSSYQATIGMRHQSL